MKRLFEVNGQFFAYKSEAKKARGEPISKGTVADPDVYGSKSEPPRYKYQVKLGPDHRNYR